MNVLAVSAHPDDETLGCGGTLLRHRAEGHPIHWLITTKAYWPKWDRECLRRKEEEIESVAAAYTMKGIHRLDFPATRLDEVPLEELMTGIQGVIERVRPEVVYLVHSGDVHSDHRIVFSACLSVMKPFHMRTWGIRRILCYETLSSTEAAAPFLSPGFVPTVFKDITGILDRKIEVLNLFKSENQSDFMPRTPSAVRALARFRGASIGVGAAEAFSLIRELD